MGFSQYADALPMQVPARPAVSGAAEVSTGSTSSSDFFELPHRLVIKPRTRVDYSQQGFPIGAPRCRPPALSL